MKKKQIRELARKASAIVKNPDKYSYYEIYNNGKMGIYIGWSDGYDTEDDGYIKDGTYGLNIGIRMTITYGNDFEFSTRPYYENGYVYDTDCTLTKYDKTIKEMEKNIEYQVKCLEELEKMVITEDGEIIELDNKVITQDIINNNGEEIAEYLDKHFTNMIHTTGKKIYFTFRPDEVKKTYYYADGTEDNEYFEYSDWLKGKKIVEFGKEIGIKKVA